jgi:hypothetical protein
MVTKSTYLNLECSQATLTFIVYIFDGWYDKIWPKQSAKQFSQGVHYVPSALNLICNSDDPPSSGLTALFFFLFYTSFICSLCHHEPLYPIFSIAIDTLDTKSSVEYIQLKMSPVYNISDIQSKTFYKIKMESLRVIIQN